MMFPSLFNAMEQKRKGTNDDQNQNPQDYQQFPGQAPNPQVMPMQTVGPMKTSVFNQMQRNMNMGMAPGGMRSRGWR